eukprot:scaffold452_cov180-Ochromonas_danica.AAC.1
MQRWKDEFVGYNQRKKVLVHLNGDYDHGKDFLNAASQRLEMASTAKRVFNADGVEIDDCMMIEDDDILFLSINDDYIAPADMTPENGDNNEGEKIPHVIGGYKVSDLLGRGGFGEVRVGEHSLTGERVALKFLRKSEILSLGAAERTNTEIQCLMALKHTHIIRLQHHMETQNHVVLVFELMEGGDLLKHLVRRKEKTGKAYLCEDEARHIFYQVISAVSYAHSQHICHRDLKLENILLKDNTLAIVKIADFGLSDFYRPGALVKSSCGTLSFLAPEVFKGTANAGPPLDVWALGVILFAVVSGRLPFEGSDITSPKRPRDSVIRTRITKCQYKMEENLGPELKDLIRRLLAADPAERMTIPEIFNHVWVRTTVPAHVIESYQFNHFPNNSTTTTTIANVTSSPPAGDRLSKELKDRDNSNNNNSLNPGTTTTTPTSLTAAVTPTAFATAGGLITGNNAAQVYPSNNLGTVTMTNNLVGPLLISPNNNDGLNHHLLISVRQGASPVPTDFVSVALTKSTRRNSPDEPDSSTPVAELTEVNTSRRPSNTDLANMAQSLTPGPGGVSGRVFNFLESPPMMSNMRSSSEKIRKGEDILTPLTTDIGYGNVQINAADHMVEDNDLNAMDIPSSARSEPRPVIRLIPLRRSNSKDMKAEDSIRKMNTTATEDDDSTSSAPVRLNGSSNHHNNTPTSINKKDRREILNSHYEEHHPSFLTSKNYYGNKKDIIRSPDTTPTSNKDSLYHLLSPPRTGVSTAITAATPTVASLNSSRIFSGSYESGSATARARTNTAASVASGSVNSGYGGSTATTTTTSGGGGGAAPASHRPRFGF